MLVFDRPRGKARDGRVPLRSGNRPSWPTRWLLVIIGIEAGASLLIRVPLLLGQTSWVGSLWVPVLLALLVVPVVVFTVWRHVRQQQRERAAASRTAHLMDTVFSTSKEWLWATGPDGRFTFSGPASLDLAGYEPSELVGRHFSLVIDPEHMATALRNRLGEDEVWDGLTIACRHKDGRQFMVEVSGRPLRNGAGRNIGFEGTTRALDPATDGPRASEVRGRVESVLAGRILIAAFQPITSLDTGAVVGAEALTRFPNSPGTSPEVRFAEAAAVGLGVELEILALETALMAAENLPPHVYVALNVSPMACLDPRLRSTLEESCIPSRRIVLEVTERHPVDDYAALAAALAGLRRSGVRLAVDDAGAGFASMRHILQLKPELIKLDRHIIAGIDTDPGHRALGAAMVGFATEIGSVLVAEGIETEGELAAVTGLGIDAGQGYLLGRPSVRPEDWTQWSAPQLQNGPAHHAGEAAGN